MRKKDSTPFNERVRTSLASLGLLSFLHPLQPPHFRRQKQTKSEQEPGDYLMPRLSGQSLRTLGAAFAYHEALGQAQRSHSAQYISPGIPFLHVTFNLLTLIAHMF